MSKPRRSRPCVDTSNALTPASVSGPPARKLTLAEVNRLLRRSDNRVLRAERRIRLQEQYIDALHAELKEFRKLMLPVMIVGERRDGR